MKSDFGKGFVYNLILFASHFERSICDIRGEKDYSIWFNGASDHLYELEIPKKWDNTNIGKTAKRLQKIALEIGHGERMIDKNTEEEFDECVKLTKKMGLLIDKELGIRPIKGNWE